MDLADCRALARQAEWADALAWKAVLAYGREDVELHAKLHHLHMMQWAYLHIWRSEPVKPREPDAFPTLASLREWARAYHRELPSYLGAVSNAKVTEWRDGFGSLGRSRPSATSSRGSGWSDRRWTGVGRRESAHQDSQTREPAGQG